MGKGTRVSDHELDRRIETLSREIAKTADATKRDALRKRIYTAKRQQRDHAAKRNKAPTFDASQEPAPIVDAPPTSVTPPPDFQIVEPAPQTPRAPRLKRAAAATSETDAQKKHADESQARAALLLLMINSYVVSTAGAEAALNDIERALIEPSLARILTRMDTKRAEQLEKYADPLAILGGLTLWFVRMRAILAERRKGSGGGNPPPPPEPFAPGPNGNGNERYANPEAMQAVEAMKLHDQVTEFLNREDRR
jgi:hypothetical protein